MTEIVFVPAKRLTAWQRLCRWLIIKLAGRMAVMVNVLVEDGAVRLSGPAFMHGCHLENEDGKRLGLELNGSTPIVMTQNYVGVRVSFTGNDFSGVVWGIANEIIL